MSDRIDFHEIRSGDKDSWDHVCIVKGEEQAETLKQILEDALPDKTFFIEHIELVANTTIEMGYY